MCIPPTSSVAHSRKGLNMAAPEMSNVLSWQIRLLKPDQFDNPDWHGIQTVLAKEFAEAIWNKISAIVFNQIEMVLVPFVKLKLTVELLTQIAAVARSLAPEAKAALNPELWKMFTELFWPGIRSNLEELIGSGKPGVVSCVTPNRLACNIKFNAPKYLFPSEWHVPSIHFEINKVVLEGIIPIVVSLEPQLGSPMN